MKFFILFIIFNLSSLTFVQAQEDFPTPEVLEAEKSIWKIENDLFTATGFFISPNLFTTNLHAIEEEKNLNSFYLKQKGNPNFLNIKQIVAISAVYDLAIIEIEGTSQHYLKLSEAKLKPDENLSLVGYLDEIFTKIKNIGRSNLINNSFFSFSVNYSELDGASGSPVLNDQEQVVGVFSRGRAFNTEISILAIKINHLKNLIAGNIGQNCKGISFKFCLEKEIENLKVLAEQGDAFGQFQLANRYMSGEGLPENNTLALHWYHKSAEQGNALAQYTLAIMYSYGGRVPKNYEKAFNWFQQAAKQGDVIAQYNLAKMYLNGNGVPQNFEEALFWLKKAAEQNHEESQDLIHKLETKFGFKQYLKIRYILETKIIGRCQSIFNP